MVLFLDFYQWLGVLISRTGSFSPKVQLSQREDIQNWSLCLDIPARHQYEWVLTNFLDLRIMMTSFLYFQDDLALSALGCAYFQRSQQKPEMKGVIFIFIHHNTLIKFSWHISVNPFNIVTFAVSISNLYHSYVLEYIFVLEWCLHCFSYQIWNLLHKVSFNKIDEKKA